MLGHEASDDFNNVIDGAAVMAGWMGECIEQSVSWFGQLSIRQPHRAALRAVPVCEPEKN